MASTAASAHPFTCNTCQVAFRSSDLQRTHMQSDWHRYNLKRRVASLPPLTSEIFAEKVLANKASAAATAARAAGTAAQGDHQHGDESGDGDAGQDEERDPAAAWSPGGTFRDGGALVKIGHRDDSRPSRLNRR